MSNRSLLIAVMLFGLVFSVSPAPAATKIMALGDSITLGTGRGLPKRGGWRIDFWKLCKKAGFSIDMVGSRADGPDDLGDKDNEGHAGYRIKDLAKIAPILLKKNPPDLILLMIGTHDAVLWTGIDSAPAQLESLIADIVKAAPQARLVVSSIPPINSVPGTAAAAKLNARIPGIVKAISARGNQVFFADTFTSIQIADLDAGGMSPKAGGYAKMGKFLFEQVSPYLRNRSSSTSETSTNTTTTSSTSTSTTTSTSTSTTSSTNTSTETSSDTSTTTSTEPTTGPTNIDTTSEGTKHGSRTILVAASDAPQSVKASAKYVCTGSADQNTINSAFNALGGEGGKVTLSAGTFRCSNCILPTSNSWLEGKGPNETKIEVVNSSQGYIPITLLKPYVTLKGFSMYAQGFIRISTSHVSVQNVVATNMLGGKRYKSSGNGMFFIWADGVTCEDIEFLGCTAIDCNTHGYNINGSKEPKLTKNIRFVNCKAIRCGFGVPAGSRSEWTTGFDFHESQKLDGLIVQGCIAEDNWQCGFHLEPAGEDSYMRNLVFKDCSSSNNGRRHPNGESSYYASGFHGFKNCTMTNCHARNNANSGFFGIYTTNCSMTNCSDDGSNHGFKFAKSNDGITLENCSTKNNKTWGLWIAGTNRMKVINFHQYNVRGARGSQSILGWYKDEAKYQKPVTNSSFEITAHGGSGEIINKEGSGNTYSLKRE